MNPGHKPDLTGKVKRMAANAAGVALATGGLSSCGGVGVVDPAPPPACNTVSEGQTLTATAERSNDTVTVRITPVPAHRQWRVSNVSDVTGVVLVAIEPPANQGTLVLRLRTVSDTTTHATVALDGTIANDVNETCVFRRVFTITISAGGVQVSELDLGLLPLPARDRATIQLAVRRANVVDLVANTSYAGDARASWDVSAGSIETVEPRRVRWTLPQAAGIYQAELVLDFGDRGMAFDALQLEVTE